jgi:surfactin synthase thioesterase subunit
MSGGVWLRRFRDADPDAPRLVCLPHAGGAASGFLPMARALAPRIEVLAVQYPGRQDRRSEPPATGVGQLADSLAAVVEELLPGPPVAFFGHSMGALLAYEIATRTARPPRLLFASAARVPSATRVNPDILADGRRLVEEVLALGATEPEVLDHPDLREMVIPPIRADYAALAAYRPGSPVALPMPIIALVGDRDPRVSVEQARGWAEHTSERFDLQVFRGGHFYLNSRLPELSRTVTAELAAVAPSSSHEPGE